MKRGSNQRRNNQLSIDDIHNQSLSDESYNKITECLGELGKRAIARLGGACVREIIHATFIWVVKASRRDRISETHLKFLRGLHATASKLPTVEDRTAASAALRKKLQVHSHLMFPPPGSQRFDYKLWQAAELLHRKYSEDLKAKRPVSEEATALLDQLRDVDPSLYSIPDTFLGQLGDWLSRERNWLKEDKKRHFRKRRPVDVWERAIDGMLKATFRVLALKTSARELTDDMRSAELKFISTALTVFGAHLRVHGIVFNGDGRADRIWAPRGIEDIRHRLATTQSNPKLQKIESHRMRSFILFLKINCLYNVGSIK